MSLVPRAARAVRTTQWPPASAWSARSRCVRPAWKPIRGSGTPGTTPCGPWVSPWHLSGTSVTSLAPPCPCPHHCVTPTWRPIRGSGTPGPWVSQCHLSVHQPSLVLLTLCGWSVCLSPAVPVLTFVLVTPVPVSVLVTPCPPVRVILIPVLTPVPVTPCPGPLQGADSISGSIPV